MKGRTYLYTGAAALAVAGLALVCIPEPGRLDPDRASPPTWSTHSGRRCRCRAPATGARRWSSAPRPASPSRGPPAKSPAPASTRATTSSSSRAAISSTRPRRSTRFAGAAGDASSIPTATSSTPGAIATCCRTASTAASSTTRTTSGSPATATASSRSTRTTARAAAADRHARRLRQPANNNTCGNSGGDPERQPEQDAAERAGRHVVDPDPDPVTGQARQHLHRRRLRQPPRRRVPGQRQRHGDLAAAVGRRGRNGQQPGHRLAGPVRVGRRRPSALRRRSATTSCSTSATAPTTGSRSSPRPARCSGSSRSFRAPA